MTSSQAESRSISEENSESPKPDLVRRALQFIADWWPALFTGVAATGLSSFLYLGSFLTFKAGYVGYGLGFLLGGLATNAMPPAIVWGAMRWIK